MELNIFIGFLIVSLLKIIFFKLYVKYSKNGKYNPNMEGIFFIVLLSIYLYPVRSIMQGDSIGLIHFIDFIAIVIIFIIRYLYFKLYIEDYKKTTYNKYIEYSFFLVMLIIYFEKIRGIIKGII